MSDYTVSIDLTPEQLAQAFWAMGSDEQADFFAALDRMAGVKLCFQMAGVVHEICERAEKGDHAAQNGFQTMLSHAQDYVDGATRWRIGRAKAAIRYGATP